MTEIQFTSLSTELTVLTSADVEVRSQAYQLLFILSHPMSILKVM